LLVKFLSLLLWRVFLANSVFRVLNEYINIITRIKMKYLLVPLLIVNFPNNHKPVTDLRKI
jgi:hypothetical protein